MKKIMKNIFIIMLSLSVVVSTSYSKTFSVFNNKELKSISYTDNNIKEINITENINNITSSENNKRRKIDMKKIIKRILTVIISVMVLLIIAVSIAATKMKPPQTITISPLDITTVKDGKYIGEHDNGVVSAKVEVNVADKKITEIKIIKHNNGLGKKAETIVNDVVAKQSLKVDAITKATHSSMTILKAIEKALMLGVN